MSDVTPMPAGQFDAMAARLDGPPEVLPGLAAAAAQARRFATSLSPDCAAGEKHKACVGQAWDDEHDCLTRCECDCHRDHQEHT